jgi:hypothetical protein
MPKQRTPTTKLKLLGSFKKHPERERPDDVDTGAFPDEPPAHLADDVKVCWVEIRDACYYSVLQAADVFLVELTSGLLAELRRDPDKMLAARLTQLRVCLGQLGLSPTDRSKLSVPAAVRGKSSSLLDGRGLLD